MYPKGDFLCQRTYSMSMDGWNLVMRILNVTKCITFAGKIEKVACQ